MKWLTAFGFLVLGLVLLGGGAVINRELTGRAPLFARADDIPSTSESAPSPHWAAAVERARPMVRAAIMDQNLPGISMAVGVGADAGTVVWAEGFGWRDIVTKAPVTPKTRFNIGTAARAITAGTVDSAADWSPGHIGEDEEDAPPIVFIHDVLRRVGIADPAKPLPDDRATFYVPSGPWQADSTDPHRRRLMPMRDLACCANGKAFSSTPFEIVRFALTTKADSVNGELAGGRVLSLVTRPDKGIAVAVASNIAHADTAALAMKVAEVF